MAISEHDFFKQRAQELIDAGRFLHAQGWVPATSGNFSARLDKDQAAITVSGRHKGHLTQTDIMRVDGQGRTMEPGKRPSAETVLHTSLYQRDNSIGCILHTHSPNATVISRINSGQIVLSQYELLKAFTGIDTHDTELAVPIFANDQDIPRLQKAVDAYLDHTPDIKGYLIAGHGLYTWGASTADALRHVEAFEFLFDCELRQQGGRS